MGRIKNKYLFTGGLYSLLIINTVLTYVHFDLFVSEATLVDTVDVPTEPYAIYVYLNAIKTYLQIIRACDRSVLDCNIVYNTTVSLVQ